jgi:hypothetical protein
MHHCYNNNKMKKIFALGALALIGFAVGQETFSVQASAGSGDLC